MSSDIKLTRTELERIRLSYDDMYCSHGGHCEHTAVLALIDAKLAQPEACDETKAHIEACGAADCWWPKPWEKKA